MCYFLFGCKGTALNSFVQEFSLKKIMKSIISPCAKVRNRRSLPAMMASVIPVRLLVVKYEIG